MKTIEIKCKGNRYLPISELTELQGNLKELTKVNAEKLERSILKYGFSFPVFVWKNSKHNYIIDAHQRLLVLKQMIKDGFTLPDLPVCDIEAKDIKEAKEKLLMLNSQYGTITDEGLYEFIETAGIEFDNIKDDLEFRINLDKFGDNFYNDLEEVEIKEPEKENIKCPECGYEFK